MTLSQARVKHKEQVPKYAIMAVLINTTRAATRRRERKEMVREAPAVVSLNCLESAWSGRRGPGSGRRGTPSPRQRGFGLCAAGETDKAVDCLEKSIAHRWGQREWMQLDSHLAVLRNHPSFPLSYASRTCGITHGEPRLQDHALATGEYPVRGSHAPPSGVCALSLWST